MKDEERNYYNAFVKIRDFGTANEGAIGHYPMATANFALVAAGVEAIEASGELQSSGAIGQGVARKDFVLDTLMSMMRSINRTSRTLAVDDPPVAELFRMPHGNNEQKTLAAARAFLTNAGPLEARFREAGMRDGFLANLERAIENYAQAISQKNTASTTGVGATAKIGATIRDTLKAVRRLRGIVPNIFEDDPAKLAEWASASHVERPPKPRAAG
ncbi:MAG: hypothetical protein JSS81_23925 [Acidobacteria bacterium]|nr:hypothetical protein [Acidobacteriota bacterium]